MIDILNCTVIKYKKAFISWDKRFSRKWFYYFEQPAGPVSCGEEIIWLKYSTEINWGL
jgi:hypothetical protein